MDHGPGAALRCGARASTGVVNVLGGTHMSSARRIVGLIVAALVLGSCTYYTRATDAAEHGTTPWWCTSHRGDPGDQRARGRHASTTTRARTRRRCPSDDCKTMSLQFDVARAYALQWPTERRGRGRRLAMATPYIPGMGTHHIRGGITPAMLADPSFDRHNPILDAPGSTTSSTRPSPRCCSSTATARRRSSSASTTTCGPSTGSAAGRLPRQQRLVAHPPVDLLPHDRRLHGRVQHQRRAAAPSLGGINVNMANYYMLHVWVLDDMKFEPDVYAGMIPCIAGGTAIHDPNDSCHTSRTMAAHGHGRHGDVNRPAVVGLEIGDEPDAWRAAGFTVDGDVTRVGGIDLHLVGRADGKRIRAWTWTTSPVTARSTASRRAPATPRRRHRARTRTGRPCSTTWWS